MEPSEKVAEVTQKKNPDKALDAICAPSKLTLSQIAVLERIHSPLMYGKTQDTIQNIVGVYAATAKNLGEVLRAHRDGTLEDKALEWSQQFTDPNDFVKVLAGTLDAIAAFWSMLPRPGAETDENGKPKKDTASETASSLN